MAQKHRRLSLKTLLALAILVFSLVAGVALIEADPAFYAALQDEETAQDHAAAPSLKADWDHILHGDETGGGHLYGTGIPCKSEFPQDWDADRIRVSVSRMAANDNAGWRQEDNGYFVSEQMAGPLKIRVVLDEKRAEIVTAYPVNGARNPCPAHDNRP